MTRGRIVVVLNNEIMLVSTEFNGDMYYQSLGKKVVEGLKKVENEQDYRKFVEDFNSENFGYKEELVYKITEKAYIEHLNMEDDYLDKWNSSYIYVKNLSDKEVCFIGGNGEAVLYPNKIGIFFFGNGDYDIKENELKRVGVVTLREKLEKMSFDEQMAWAYENVIHITTKEELEECGINHLYNDNYSTGVHIMKAINSNPYDTKYYRYDYSRGIFETPKPITCLEDIEDLLDLDEEV